MKFALLAVSLVTISFSAMASLEKSITAEVLKDLNGVASCFNGKLKDSGRFELGYTMVETEVLSKTSTLSVCNTMYDNNMNPTEYTMPSYMGCEKDESVKSYVTVTDVQTFQKATFEVTTITTYAELLTTNPADMKHVTEVVTSEAVKETLTCKAL